MMLNQIANFCPVISRRTIVNDSTSLNSVWSQIKLHFGFQTTGANFIDFVSIKYSPPERAETLYQRMLTFIENNLLYPGIAMTHKGADINEYEDLSPTLENMIVLLWLQQIHPGLPGVVKQKYGADLRCKTLASLKPEISLALPTLIDEAKSADSRVMRSFPRDQNFPRHNTSNADSTHNRRPRRSNDRFNRGPRQPTLKTCPLCKAAGRDASHYLSTCQHLPEADKRFLTRARQVVIEDCATDFSDAELDDNTCEQPQPTGSSPLIRRVNVRSSPFFHSFYKHSPLSVILDTGAETSLMKSAVARSIDCPIHPTTQTAYQADGKTPLKVLGETHISLFRDDIELKFSGLIVDNLDVDILAGVPFMEDNDIGVRPRGKLISIGDNYSFRYDGNALHIANKRSCILRTTARSTVWPGEFLDVKIPGKESTLHDSLVAIEPHASSTSCEWPSPGIYQSVSGTIRLVNNTDTPQNFSKHAHIAMVSPTYDPDHTQADFLDDHCPKAVDLPPAPKSALSTHSNSVVINQDNVVDTSHANKFAALHRRYDTVFDPAISTYNHKFGRFEAVVNMGPVLPQQRKGRIPQYSRDKLVELQARFDELEALGILTKPETSDVVIEYLNPSFLVKKPNRPNEYRFVTAFTEVGKYCKPQPSLMPSVDSTLRAIARWKFLIKTDLTSAFYQIPLAKDSMRFCGVVSPFKGVRCYTRCAMGMPGSETALEELMCRILGDLVTEGKVAKIADDLYCGSETEEDLLSVWESVLRLLQEANLKLSAKKTVVFPTKTTILGWTWENGYISADPHKVASLSTCTRPSTTKGLRSFIGAYKVLARVLPNSASLLRPLDRATNGKKSGEKVTWDEDSIAAFEKAQKHLTSNKAIILPKEEDQLWLITDGASSTCGLGATLYALRDTKLLLAGFFSQQLSPSYVKWFPCEIEGITIACAVKFFEGFITQSTQRTQVLTDSKPCVDAYNKLLRGQFSSNARLSTYLSAACRHHIVIRHIAGAINLPSDFASRNPVACNEPACQMCLFAKSLDDSVVRAVPVRDILDGTGHLPFTSRSAWHATQSECRDLRRTRAHLLQGTRPSKKETRIKSVKRYLSRVSLSSDGLLVVAHTDALSPSREAIVVPEEILPGLLSALHLRLNHPSQTELAKVVRRYFWAINLDSAIATTSTSCHLCASLSKVPKSLIPQSSSDPPDSVGTNFGVDVMRRERQAILVVREYVSAFTWSTILPTERGDDLRASLVMLIQDVVPLDGPNAVVRADNAPGFKNLVDDAYLKDNRISIDLGRVKNPNKNPVAERAVQELEHEILRVHRAAGPLSSLMLHKATASLNSRIRTDGLSAREVLLQRDQFTNLQIPLNDRTIIAAKHSRSVQNHQYSERSKAGGSTVNPDINIQVGDLVYLYSDKDKNAPRERYLVTSVDNEWCYIRKFVGDTLRANSHKVKRNEIFRVPSNLICPNTKVEPENEEDDLEVVVPSQPSNVDPVTSDAHPTIVHLDNPQNTPPQVDTEALPIPVEICTPAEPLPQIPSGAPETLRRSTRVSRPPQRLGVE